MDKSVTVNLPLPSVLSRFPKREMIPQRWFEYFYDKFVKTRRKKVAETYEKYKEVMKRAIGYNTIGVTVKRYPEALTMVFEFAEKSDAEAFRFSVFKYLNNLIDD